MERFYVEALGLEPVPESRAEGWVELRAGEVAIALHAIPPDIAREIEISSPPAAREETPLKMVFEVEDPDGVRSRIAACGGVTIGRPWGFDAADPEGNVFHVAQASQRRPE